MRIRKIFAGLAVGGLLIGAAACTSPSAATTSAKCGAIVGKGGENSSGDGNDRKVHKFVFPEQNISYDENTETAVYWDCGPRNYIINDGTVKNANGKTVGDRLTPTQVWTKAADNKPSILLNIWSSTFWTPNQGQMPAFFKNCIKYHCYTEDATKAADANYSEPGWNGMLGEDFGGTVDKTALFIVVGAGTDKTISFTSDIVSNPLDWVKLGNAMSADFTTRVRTVTGYSEDLFCGSGTGGWKDPNKPGEGPFTCNNVRVEIDRIEPADPDVKKQMLATGALKLQEENNKARVAVAKQLYGDNWAYFLGVQDTIEKCQASAKQVCVVNFGNGNVSVPVGQR